MTDLTARRDTSGTWTVSNASGAELRIGAPGEEGAFSPGELLQAALAACSVLSAETQLAHNLGADYEATATVEGVDDEGAGRVAGLRATISPDMSALDPAEQEKLIARAERVIERLCAIKRSLNHGVAATAEVRPRR
ncbi:osmotically inducible protein C [Corynebacterium hylobatis]|uniref:Osmotically inducible protein C n=1 Tax=Corynebacterium hylobatis TaxID=1859290 RepID=A0A3S0B673_9CORY|nr:OsmC family protein [Corynebacterium hylobatis]RSZ66075.1 osmotically inducible protein C [Corynebacterium hylobatis]